MSSIYVRRARIGKRFMCIVIGSMVILWCQNKKQDEFERTNLPMNFRYRSHRKRQKVAVILHSIHYQELLSIILPLGRIKTDLVIFPILDGSLILQLFPLLTVSVFQMTHLLNFNTITLR